MATPQAVPRLRRVVAGWRSSLITTRMHSQRTRNLPCSQAKRSRLVVSTCVLSPVVGLQLEEMLVRTDSCIAAMGVCCVFMGINGPEKNESTRVNCFAGS